MRIGVFGGTFDPVHYGHIELARQAVNECSLDKLIVIPVNEQPFKMDRALAHGRHRYNMLKLAFECDDKIIVSDIELAKGDVSYTIDTLREIKRLYENAEISFIVGIDAFLKVEMWKDSDELLRDYSFIIGTRPGYLESELDGLISSLLESHHTNVMKIDNMQIPVSSTEIKESIKSGKGYGEALAPEVERYIITNGLYS
jgi:nicotinate-nucleotide adenylyltransferase